MGDVVLRSDALAWRIHFETDNGWRFDDFDLLEIDERDDAVTLIARCPGQWMPRRIDADTCGEVRHRFQSFYGFKHEPARAVLISHLWNPDLDLLGPDGVEPLIQALPRCAELGFTGDTSSGTTSRIGPRWSGHSRMPTCLAPVGPGT